MQVIVAIRPINFVKDWPIDTTEVAEEMCSTVGEYTQDAVLQMSAVSGLAARSRACRVSHICLQQWTFLRQPSQQ
jgi:hypothetical protein